MADSKYCPQLDGLRTFCIVFTVLNHIPADGRPWFVDGTVGVDAFFPLSGWLITWLLLEERRKEGRIDLGAFYLRRIFRIVPLYYLTIGIYTGTALAVYLLTGNSAKLDELRNAALYLVTFNSEYRPDDAGVIFGHAWTLGIEEKFYVVWPLMLFLAGRFTVVAVVGAFIVIGALFGLFGTSDYLVRGYFGLGVGAVMAIWLNSSPYETVVRNMPIGWISLAMTVVMYAGLVTAPSLYWHLGLAASVSFLIASVWFDREQGLARFLARAPLVWLGTLTYAIYLFQTLASNLVQALLQKLHLHPNFLTILLAVYAVSVALAWLAHVAIEQPAISIGRRLAAKRKIERSALIPARPEV